MSAIIGSHFSLNGGATLTCILTGPLQNPHSSNVVDSKRKMDLLVSPPTEEPVYETPYLCTENWDGGDFRSYVLRKDKEHIFTMGLFQLRQSDILQFGFNKPGGSETKTEIQAFLQTWLFIGLICEFLGLNEAPDVPDRDPETATVRIAEVHQICSKERDGKLLLTGSPVIDMKDEIETNVRTFPNVQQRLFYLRDCLQAANVMLHTPQCEVDHTVRYSIAALGELLTAALYTAASFANPKIDLPVVGFNWQRDFVVPGGQVEKRMLDYGWCPSEIQKVRTQFQALNTLHYFSRVVKGTPPEAHSSCTSHRCQAFQIDLASYSPAHATENCECSDIEVALDEMSDILHNTDTFPVLEIKAYEAFPDNVEVVVKPYQEGVEYVALSHIWADGLGNPRSCSLPRCQMARIGGLVHRLNQDSSASKYHVWVDTICCPIELEGKKIALERIADVYRKASHVLVLESSLMKISSTDAPPGYLLLQTFGASSWMRRLWTLQEGALAQNLIVQFGDKAVGVLQLSEELFKHAMTDVRYMRLWQDMMNEFNHLRCFKARFGHSLDFPRPTLVSLQRAIHFRTVTVPSDEPLCIATLLSLDLKTVAAVETHEERMVEIWRLAATILGGLPTRLIFYMDESLDTPGWRWAPKTLLSPPLSSNIVELDAKFMRFAIDELSVDQPAVALGTPTPLGLKANLRGCIINAHPHGERLPMNPWTEVLNSTEDQIVIFNEERNAWYRVIDWYRSRNISVWTREEKLAYDKKADCPLHKSIATGHCALIYDAHSAISETMVACMVQINNDLSNPDNLVVRRERTVLIAAIGEKESRILSLISKMAQEAALDSVTTDLVGIEDKQGSEWEASLTKVRERLKEMTKTLIETDSSFLEDVSDTMGAGLEDFIWVLPPKLFPCRAVMRDLPATQTWSVD